MILDRASEGKQARKTAEASARSSRGRFGCFHVER
jgi:hypothetical protein